MSRRMMMTSPTPAHSVRIDKGKFMHVATEEVARGEFLTLSKYKYIDSSGIQKDWEVAGRCPKPGSADADSVCVLPVLRRMLKYDCLVLVKQYRPSMKAFTLEFPAGIVESDDRSSKFTALNRLHSQTGYTTNNIKYVSPLTASDPVHTSCSMKIVSVEVNGDDFLNINTQQTLSDGEFYEVLLIPVNDALERLNEYSEEGYIIDSRVYTFAIGLTVGVKMTKDRNTPKEDNVHIIKDIMDHQQQA